MPAPKIWVIHWFYHSLKSLTFPQTAGKNANPEERKAALTAANKFIKDKNYSLKTQVKWSCSVSLLPELQLPYLVYFFMNMLVLLSVSDMYRFRWCQQGVRAPCLSSSSSTGWTRMRLQAKVSPTLWVMLLMWSRFPSIPPYSTATREWLPSTAWWMMALGKSRYGHWSNYAQAIY